MKSVRLTIRLLSPHHRLTPWGKTPLSRPFSAPPREIPLVTTDRSLRTFFVALVLVLSVVASLSFASTAGAATKCGQQVLADWYDNGRIDRLYPLNCYEEAIDAIPNDIGPYVDAEEVITRALQGALHGDVVNGGCDPSADGSADDCSRQPGGGSNGGTAATVAAAVARPETAAKTPGRSRPRSTPPARRRCRSRCSSSAGCRSCSSQPAASDTSRAAASQRTPTTSTATILFRSPQRPRGPGGYTQRVVCALISLQIADKFSVGTAPYSPLPARMTNVAHPSGKS